MIVLEDFKNNFYKSGTKIFDPKKVVFSVLILLALVVFIIYNNTKISERINERKKDARYTIGITGNKYYNPKSSKPIIEFSYCSNGVIFTGTESIGANCEKNVIAKGGRYFVEFSSKNPNNCELLLNSPVPDSILIAPDDGWNRLP